MRESTGTVDELVASISAPEREAFADQFLRAYLAGGMGAMSKRETELLVFHCLERTQYFRSLSFYNRANALRVLESKVKSLKADATQRYAPLNHKAAIREIAIGVVRDRTIIVAFENDRIVLAIEDPSLRRELEHALRRIGSRVDYTLNRDVIGVKVPAFLELLKRTLAFGDEQLAGLLADAVKDTKDSNKLLDSRLPLSDRVNRYLHENKGIASAVESLFGGILKLAVTGSP